MEYTNSIIFVHPEKKLGTLDILENMNRPRRKKNAVYVDLYFNSLF